jgi:hypothetical protein
MAVIAFEMENLTEEEKKLIPNILQLALTTYIGECKGAKFVQSCLPQTEGQTNYDKLIDLARKMVEGAVFRLVVK